MNFYKFIFDFTKPQKNRPDAIGMASGHGSYAHQEYMLFVFI